MTEAMFDWLEDESAVHPLCLDAAIDDFSIMLGIYASGLSRRVVTLPSEPVLALIDTMRQSLDDRS